MLKRTIVFSNPYHISCKLKQLTLTNKQNGETRQLPVEDLGYVILDDPQITITQAAIQEMAENNTAVVFCNEKHHPASMLLHLDGHHIQSQRFQAQISASQPLQKQLWQQVIKMKLRNQAALLDQVNQCGDALRKMATTVKSGDSDNIEAQAARYYWKNIFSDGFKRERYGAAPNNFLNYGYAILRAAVAKGLVGAGLLPTLGIHHRNKYNAFCLADDMMEPYRPYVDQLVVELNNSGKGDEITTEHKQHLLSILTHDVMLDKSKSPLAIAVSRSCSSLAQCFEGAKKQLTFAEMIS